MLTEERLLFNLIIMAIEWDVWLHGKRKTSWEGRRIDCTACMPLRRLSSRIDDTIAIIWPDTVVTNKSFGLTEKEINQGLFDINDILAEKFLDKEPS